eukprot:m.339144 g.339144  ORF g.339144 m.339144 type:complete len:1076 (+) comp18685_c0_seq1:260-3487(+)
MVFVKNLILFLFVVAICDVDGVEYTFHPVYVDQDLPNGSTIKVFGSYFNGGPNGDVGFCGPNCSLTYETLVNCHMRSCVGPAIACVANKECHNYFIPTYTYGMNREFLRNPVGQQYAACMDSSCDTAFLATELYEFPPAPNEGSPILQGCNELLIGEFPGVRIIYCGYGFREIPQYMDITFDTPEALILVYTANLLEKLTTESFSFTGQSPVLQLLLGVNLITSVEDYTFANMPFLTQLDLGDNLLPAITSCTFCGCKAVEELRLYRNELTVIHRHAFEDLPKLKILDLHHNSLTRIDPLATKGLDQLESLDLSDNKLNVIEKDTFKYMANLHTLSLAGNNLARISPQGFVPLWNLTRENLRVEGNALVSCSLGSDRYITQDLAPLKGQRVISCEACASGVGVQFDVKEDDVIMFCPTLNIQSTCNEEIEAFEQNANSMPADYYVDETTILPGINCARENLFTSWTSLVNSLSVPISTISYRINVEALGLSTLTRTHKLLMDENLESISITPKTYGRFRYTIFAQDAGGNTIKIASWEKDVKHRNLFSLVNGGCGYQDFAEANLSAFVSYVGKQTVMNGLGKNCDKSEAFQDYSFQDAEAITFAFRAKFNGTYTVMDDAFINSDTGRSTFTPQQPGWHEWEVFATDRSGREVIVLTKSFEVKYEENKFEYSEEAIAAITLGSVVIIGLLAAGAYFLKRHIESRRPHNFEKDFEYLSEIGFLKLDTRKKIRNRPREISRSHVILLGELGTGAFGCVKQAILDEKRSDQIPYMVAAKILKPSKEGLREQDDLFQEAAVMAQLGSHHNLVSLVGVVTIGVPKMLVMDYCEHGSLLRYLKKQKTLKSVSEKHRCKFLVQIAHGMAYLASQSYVHRDLATRNILLDLRYSCRVADFGLSRRVISHNVSKDEDVEYYRSARGTVAIRWAAPEAFASHLFTEASDVWAWGIVAIEIYTNGTKPYPDLKSSELPSKIMSGFTHLQPPTMGDDMFEFLQTCWKMKPTKRPSFKQICNHMDAKLQILKMLPDNAFEKELVQRAQIDPATLDGGYAQIHDDRLLFDEGHYENTLSDEYRRKALVVV